MKAAAWIGALVIVGVIAYVALGPYLTVSAIKTGIVENDAETLSDHIEFPTLRQNLKEQLRVVIMKSAATEVEDNPFGVLLAGLATTFVDGMLDSLVTPSGLESMMEGHEPSTERSSSSTSTKTTKERDDLFRDARTSYDSLSKFSVWVPNDAGGETRFVLKRSGLSWKLVNILIPIDEPR